MRVGTEHWHKQTFEPAEFDGKGRRHGAIASEFGRTEKAPPVGVSGASLPKHRAPICRRACIRHLSIRQQLHYLLRDDYFYGRLLVWYGFGREGVGFGGLDHGNWYISFAKDDGPPGSTGRAVRVAYETPTNVGGVRCCRVWVPPAGLSGASRRTSAAMLWWAAGRPGRLCWDLRIQRRRRMSRRQHSTVSGVIMRRRPARRPQG
jgi:hypothetical protein